MLSFYVTYKYFIYQWQHKFPGNNHHLQSNQLPHLTYDEQSALWYVAGYILKKIRKQVGDNDEALALVDSFTEWEDDTTEDLDDEANSADELTSENWLKLINRGGLKKCTNDFYVFIQAVELEIKTFLSDKPFQGNGKSDPKSITSTIMSKEKVKDSWQVLVGGHEVEEMEFKIIRLCVTVHCFAFCKEENGTSQTRTQRTQMIEIEQEEVWP